MWTGTESKSLEAEVIWGGCGCGGCSEIQNPEPRATLSAPFVCSSYETLICIALLQPTLQLGEKQIIHYCKNAIKQMKHLKVFLLNCPFRVESWKALLISVPQEGDWGLGRLSELPKVTQEVSELTRNNTQDSCLLHHISNHWTLFPDGSKALYHSGLPATSNSILPL